MNAMRGDAISYEGLNVYEAQCIDANLNYFYLPYPRFKRVFKESEKVINLHNLDPILWISFLYVLQDGRLCIGFDNGDIKIFNSTTFECKMELLGHSRKVCCTIQLSDGRLCTASCDNTIKLWNLSSGECEATLVGHELPVTAVLQYSSTQLCSGSYDQTIRLWNIESGVCEATITHSNRNKFGTAYFALLPNGLVASLTSIGYLTILNIETRDVIEIEIEHNCGYCMIQLASGDLCIGNKKNGEITILDHMTYLKLKTFTIIEKYAGIQSMALLMDGRVAVSMTWCSSLYKREYEEEVHIYNIDTGESEQILRGIIADGIVQLSDGRLCIKNRRDELILWK
jgi:WD40 repeat protein